MCKIRLLIVAFNMTLYTRYVVFLSSKVNMMSYQIITVMIFNSFGRKFQTTFVVCFFNKLSFGKTFICKDVRLNVKQRRSR